MKRCFQWAFTPGAHDLSDDGKDGIGSVLTLGSGVFLGTAAMVSFLQEAGPTKFWFIWFIYLPGIFIPLLTLRRLLLLNRQDGETVKANFDPATLTIGRRVLVVSFLAVVGVVTAGAMGKIPGQPAREARPLLFDDAYLSTRKDDGKQEIIASIAVTPQSYPNGYPNPLEISFHLSEAMRRHWSLSHSQLFEEGRDGKRTFLRAFEWDYGKYRTAVIENHLKSNTVYRVELHLVADKQLEPALVDADIKTITEGKGVTALDRSDL